MSHGDRWCSVLSKLSLNTRFVCMWTSSSTNSWSILFLLWEWIHPSIDQYWSHTDTDQMTPGTLYTNLESSLNRGSPVLWSVTPSRNVDIQVTWGSLNISVVKTPWTSSLTSSSKRYCQLNVVSHDCVSMCTKEDYGLHCHWDLLGSHNIHKHLILSLHLVQILAPRNLGKILHHWPDILLDTGIHQQQLEEYVFLGVITIPRVLTPYDNVGK